MESISKRVSTSIPNGANWDDVQNAAEAAKKSRVQQQEQDHNAFCRRGIYRSTHERYGNSPDQISKTLEKVGELTVEEGTLERNDELFFQIPSFEEIKNEIAKMKDVAPREDEIRLRYMRSRR